MKFKRPDDWKQMTEALEGLLVNDELLIVHKKRFYVIRVGHEEDIQRLFQKEEE